MARTTRGSSASPAKAPATAKARVVATPGANVASPRKVGRPPKNSGREQQQEMPTPPSTGTNGNSSSNNNNTKVSKSSTAAAATAATGGSGDGKRFSCPYCGQAFSRKYDMQKHSRKHTGDKPYKCGVCGRQFVQVGSLAVHMVSGVEASFAVCSTHSRTGRCIIRRRLFFVEIQLFFKPYLQGDTSGHRLHLIIICRILPGQEEYGQDFQGIGRQGRWSSQNQCQRMPVADLTGRPVSDTKYSTAVDRCAAVQNLQIAAPAPALAKLRRLFPARPHRRDAVQMQHLRQGLRREGATEAPRENAHRREAVSDQL